MSTQQAPKTLLNPEEIGKTLQRIAFEIQEQFPDKDNLALIGIQRRGADLAGRIRDMLAGQGYNSPRIGELDINMYRDDWTNLSSVPQIGTTNIPFEVNSREIILIDDVLYTGRTIRAALEAILDFGRPKRIALAVLVDRGHRELPIHADFIGKTINTSREEQIDVLTLETDGKDRVSLSRGQP
ncbi:MAG: bifunctional pyr operon transcriptional regulator/uracil phosphoribosyltransferase PyrR [Thermodesulfobacteriota bacterium]